MKNILITGCCGDIGSYLCDSFRDMGYFTIGIDIDDSNINCDRFIKMDLSNPDWSVLPKDEIDIIINNAATQIICNFNDFEDSDIDFIFEVNLISIIKMIKRINLSKDSNIINIGSIHSSQSKPGFSLYATTKGGLETLTRSLSIELTPKTRVNMVKPAAILTKMLSSGLSVNELSTLSDFHPTKCIGDVRNIFDCCKFIIDNNFVNGSIIDVDGGISNILHDPKNLDFLG